MARQTIGGETAYDAAYISTATTTTVKSSTAYLKRIIITETAAGTITIYDNTAASGTIKAVFKASVAEGTYDLDLDMNTGITIVTGAASKVTVVYA